MVFKKLLVPNAARRARAITRHHDDRYCIDLLTRDGGSGLYSQERDSNALHMSKVSQESNGLETKI